MEKSIYICFILVTKIDQAVEQKIKEKLVCIFVTKIDQVEQEIKQKLDCSASNKLDRPTSEMPGKHQPSAFSTKIFISKSIFFECISVPGMQCANRSNWKCVDNCVNFLPANLLLFCPL